MATTTYGSPYVQSSDLVSGWPTASQNVANRIDDVALKGNGVNAQTGAGYTLVLTDAGKTVTVSNASAQNLTVPLNASVAFPTGTLIRIVNIGAGTWTLAGSPTINGTTAIPNKGAVQLLKTGTDTWWASAMDTAVGGGLAFITSQSFSAASAVNVNNCFTSAYENYRIVGLITPSAAGNITMRMRLSGTDNSGATAYDIASFAAMSNALSEMVVGTATSAGHLVRSDASVDAYIDYTVFRPAVAVNTKMAGTSVGAKSGAAGTTAQLTAMNHQVATAYDGFSILPASGTLTGNIRVYGYRNS